LGGEIEYVGYIKNDADKQEFLGDARVLLVPSTFEEPFGMVSIESLACGTPVIGLNRGATGEIIDDGQTGFIVDAGADDLEDSLARAIDQVSTIDRAACREAFERRFTLEKMVQAHADLYTELFRES